MKIYKIIIFGGSGFLGSHVADELTNKGHSVTVFDRNNSKYITKNQTMIVGDILDYESVNNAIRNHEIVYNFAGISDIDQCHENPIDTAKYNIIGNLNILKSSILQNVRKYLFASSAYVYSNSGSYYRISKQSSELFTESMTDDSDLNYVILRYGSLYGERADNRNSLHRILDNAVKHGEIKYFGSGNEVREFIHVKDAAKLSMKALKKRYDNQILMLTGSKSIKYIDLLDMIREIFQNKVKISIHPSSSKTHYKMSPYSFNPKMAKKLVCNPHVDLGQGILSLIEKFHKDSNQ